MKPEVQCLLEYYTGEKLYSVPQYGVSGLECGGSIAGFLGQAVLHGILGPAQLGFAGAVGPTPRGFVGAVGQAPQEIHVQLNAQQRQSIRDISRHLRRVADSLRIRPRAHVAAEEIIQHENLDRSEMQVVNNICSIRSETTVSRIANYLQEELTPRTLRAAFRFLCYSVSTVPEELAVVCELSKLTVSKIRQLARSDSTVYDVISEFVEERLHEMY